MTTPIDPDFDFENQECRDRELQLAIDDAEKAAE